MGKSSAGTGLGLTLDCGSPALGLAGAGGQGGDLLAVEEDGLVVLARVVIEDVCTTKKSAIFLPKRDQSTGCRRSKTYSAW